jgi:hypothetical protein
MQIMTRLMPHAFDLVPALQPCAPAPVKRAAASADHLWGELDRRISLSGINTLRTLLVGFSSRDLSQILDMFGLIDAGTTASVPDACILRAADGMWDMFDCVMVNHDAFDDAETAVDEYLAFRSRSPEKALILVSREVSNDDLGTERAAICDATLRLPLSPGRLLQAMQTATQNSRATLAYRQA